MEIRKAKIEDYEKLMELVYQLSPSTGDETVDIGNLKRLIGNENHELYIAEEGKEIVGTGMLVLQMNLSHNGQNTGHIENIVVDKNHRKKGIGKKIIEFLISRAKENNCYKVILNCETKNIPFYENCSMKQTGEVEMRKDVS